MARRLKVIELLALIEHPNALPAEARLRIAGEILESLAQAESGLRCSRSALTGSPSGVLAA